MQWSTKCHIQSFFDRPVNTLSLQSCYHFWHRVSDLSKFEAADALKCTPWPYLLLDSFIKHFVFTIKNCRAIMMLNEYYTCFIENLLISNWTWLITDVSAILHFLLSIYIYWCPKLLFFSILFCESINIFQITTLGLTLTSMSQLLPEVKHSRSARILKIYKQKLMSVKRNWVH